MLSRVRAIEHHAPLSSGKTRPSRIVCERADGSTVEVVAKFSASCDGKEAALVREVIAACLAVDLGLPVPESFLVDVPRDWGRSCGRSRATCKDQGEFIGRVWFSPNN